MEIRIITSDKKRFLDLLLLGDEQEEMIDRYLERADLFALYDDGLRAVCAVTRESPGVYELKNIAVYTEYQRKGYGKALIAYVLGHYRGLCKILLAGTGGSFLTIPFYEHCGFTFSHRIKNFFTDNYDHPIYEGGTQLTDMVYLKREGLNIS